MPVIRYLGSETLYLVGDHSWEPGEERGVNEAWAGVLLTRPDFEEVKDDQPDPRAKARAQSKSVEEKSGVSAEGPGGPTDRAE